MRALRASGRVFKNFMIVFSFVVNLVLVLVVLALVLFIFDIKNNVVTPLVGGLHSSFVGLDEATIDWTIPVRDTIPVRFDLPLNQTTVVTLTEPVPLAVGATINLPGIGQLNNAQVFLQLPAGLELPVQLDLTVPVDQQLDVALDVRAVIPLSQTQLHDPLANLRLIFEPLARMLHNLPDDFGGAGQMVGDYFAGRPIDLLAENAYSRDPWFGFAHTAGLAYAYAHEPVAQENRPVETGLVLEGGIPSLDQELRPDVYEQGGPAAVNRRAQEEILARQIPPYNYDGSYADYVESEIDLGVPSAPDDLGILPTPAPGG